MNTEKKYAYENSDDTVVSLIRKPLSCDTDYPWLTINQHGATLHHRDDGTCPDPRYNLIESRPEPREITIEYNGDGHPRIVDLSEEFTIGRTYFREIPPPVAEKETVQPTAAGLFMREVHDETKRQQDEYRKASQASYPPPESEWPEKPDAGYKTAWERQPETGRYERGPRYISLLGKPLGWIEETDAHGTWHGTVVFRAVPAPVAGGEGITIPSGFPPVPETPGFRQVVRGYNWDNGGKGSDYLFHWNGVWNRAGGPPMGAWDTFYIELLLEPVPPSDPEDQFRANKAHVMATGSLEGVPYPQRRGGNEDQVTDKREIISEDPEESRAKAALEDGWLGPIKGPLKRCRMQTEPADLMWWRKDKGEWGFTDDIGTSGNFYALRAGSPIAIANGLEPSPEWDGEAYEENGVWWRNLGPKTVIRDGDEFKGGEYGWQQCFHTVGMTRDTLNQEEAEVDPRLVIRRRVGTERGDPILQELERMKPECGDYACGYRDGLIFSNNALAALKQATV